MTQRDALRRLLRVQRERWDDLNDAGRYLVLRCIRALTRDAAEEVLAELQERGAVRL